MQHPQYICCTMKLKLAFLFLSTTAFCLVGQNFQALSTSNRAGVHKLYFNPAELAGSAFKNLANAFTIGFSASTNAVSLNLPFSFLNIVTGNVPLQYKNSQGKINWDRSWFVLDKGNSAKYANANFEFRGPAYMQSLGKRNAVALAMRTRFNMSISNVSQNFIDFAINAIDSGLNSVRSISDNSVSINANAYQEYAGSFARVIIDDETHTIKLGITAKYLQGIASGSFENKELNIALAQSDDTLFINKSDVRLQYSNIDFLNKFQNNGALSFITPRFRDINGSGLGLDISGAYLWKPKASSLLIGKSPYLAKLGLAIMDIGTINMKQDVVQYSAKNNSPVKFYADSSFAAAFAQGADSGLAYIKKFAEQNLNYQQQNGQYIVNLPTTLSIQFDYNIIKNVFIGVNWNQALIGTKRAAFRRPSSFTAVPRFESKKIEFALPLLVYDDYKQFGVGAFLRLGPVFIGSDNLVKSITGNTLNGVDFYFGVSSGLPSKKKKKKD